MNIIKKEFKAIKWLKTKDVIKQTAFVIGITIISSTILLGFDTLVQFIISYN